MATSGKEGPMKTGNSTLRTEIFYKMTKNFPVGAGLPAKCSGSGKTAVRGQARSYALVPALPG